MTTGKTIDEIEAYIRQHYYGGDRSLPRVHVEDEGEGKWKASVEPELADISDRREFVSVVAMAMARFHLVYVD